MIGDPDWERILSAIYLDDGMTLLEAGMELETAVVIERYAHEHKDEATEALAAKHRRCMSVLMDDVHVNWRQEC